MPRHAQSKKTRVCELCGRTLKRGTTRHHLIPVSCHTNAWFKKRFTRMQMARTIAVCRDCHSAIHDAIPSEKELGRQYNTPELLAAHPAIEKFLTWIRKQK